MIIYTLRMTNTGPASDGFTPTISGQAWPTALFTLPGRVVIPNTLIGIQLNPGEGRTVAVVVTIPITSAGGTQAVTLFRARSQAEPGVSATGALTTATTYTLYWPLVLGQGTHPLAPP